MEIQIKNSDLLQRVEGKLSIEQEITKYLEDAGGALKVGFTN